jgi:dsRNA-specific ribonuclease
MASSTQREQILREAWLGDAVLCLYAREKILREDGRVDGERYIRMTSNQFLSSFGEASEVEAILGRVYAAEGLAAAFRWTEQELMPTFEKQEANRKKKSARRRQ